MRTSETPSRKEKHHARGSVLYLSVVISRKDKMPQEIRILKCCQCQQFQTDIVKKAKKWICKMCGVRQSVMQEYGRGTGKECRLQVEKLNEAKGTRETTEKLVLANEYIEKYNSDTNPRKIVKEPIIVKSNDENNKWSAFLDETETRESIFNYNWQETHLNTQNGQQSTKRSFLKRQLTTEDYISVNNYEDNSSSSNEINFTEKHCENKTFKLEEQSNKVNYVELKHSKQTEKLDKVLQPSSQEPVTKKSKWSHFFDQEK